MTGSVTKWGVPLLALGAGYIAGRFLDRVVLRKLETLSGKTPWEGDDVIIKAFEGVTTVLLTAAGACFAVAHLPIKPALAGILVKSLQVVVILAATVAVASLAGGFGKLYSSRVEHGLRHTSILTNAVRLIVFILGALIVMQTLGISITPILTALGVGGLAVALALQDTLSNLFSGFHIIVSDQVRPGDYVKLDSGDEGHVLDVSWRFTSIRTLSNNMVIVPNAKLAGVIVTNYHQPDKEMAVPVPVRLAYGTDLGLAERVAVEAGREVMRGTPGGVPSFEPVVRFGALGESGLDMTVILRAAEFTDQYLVKHEFIRRLYERYGREGIEFPFPTRTVHLKGGGSASEVGGGRHA
ncbi:MAG: mechanosensitive ion channel family protein [Elusimicrobia bacterium]|nr:mechanosensitive ion channel family protein [Elusimicrobiota bacterium]